MNIINNLRDLDRLVATSAFCPEPPLSERRAIHESGAWLWVRAGICQCGVRPHHAPSHWEPAPFATDPSASYALEQRMESEGWKWDMHSRVRGEGTGWGVLLTHGKASFGRDTHQSRLIAMCLAALRALGVEFELVDGWDTK